MSWLRLHWYLTAFGSLLMTGLVVMVIFSKWFWNGAVFTWSLLAFLASLFMLMAPSLVLWKLQLRDFFDSNKLIVHKTRRDRYGHSKVIVKRPRVGLRHVEATGWYFDIWVTSYCTVKQLQNASDSLETTLGHHVRIVKQGRYRARVHVLTHDALASSHSFEEAGR